VGTAAGHEPRRVPHHNRLPAQRAEQGADGVHRLLAGAGAADHLHGADEVRRVHEVGADDLRRTCGRRRQFVDGYGGGVGHQDSAGCHDGGDLGKDLLLDVRVFRDGLDDGGSPGCVGEVAAGGDGHLGGVLGQRPHELGQAQFPGDSGLGRGEFRIVHVDEGDGDAVADGQGRDTRAHNASAEDDEVGRWNFRHRKPTR
jgi:hypothetical protein